MDFLKIGKNKLKVILTHEDLRRYKLEKIGADTDLAPYRRAIFRIIDLADEAVGFDVGCDKLLLQFYPIRTGGELFATRLSILTEAQRSVISRSDNLTTLQCRTSAYELDSLDDAIALARSITSRSLPPRTSTLYITEQDTVMLEIEEQKTGELKHEFLEVLEFSSPITTDAFLYLREHSVPVYVGDAISSLSKL